MNSCNLCLENLSAYLDGELTEAENQAFEAHINACDACSDELALMTSILSVFDELEEDLPEDFETSLHDRLVAAKEENETKRNRVGKIRFISQIAAGFVLVITLGLVIRSGFFGVQKDSASGMAAPAAAPEQVAGGAMTTQQNNIYKFSVGFADDAETAMNSSSITEHDPIQVDDIGENIVDDGHVNVDKRALAMSFNEGIHNRLEGKDTLVTIRVEDMKLALDSIVAIQKKLEDGDAPNLSTLKTVRDNYYRGLDQNVEISLFYSNDVLWQEFLSEMQEAFPDMDVQSVAAKEESEHIRVLIQTVE
jgi:hypothetical protein